jgi:hypothetical protein
MSMYSQLLASVLDHGAGDEPTPDEALGQLILSRSRLAEAASSGSESAPVSIALADQLSYDVALIALATSIGIRCDVRRFERPEVERNRLEGALQSRGVDLDAIGDDQLRGRQ